MSWLRLILECQEQHVDALSHLFEQFDAVSISIEALSDEALFGGIAEDPSYWHRTAISALFDASIDLDILLACARNRIGTENLLNSQIEAIADSNWLDARKADHGEIIFTDRLCIRPSWVEASKEYPATLVLDPGLAFGSGRHNTTALCLDWLASQDLDSKRVTDYGCGSGILGLAAAKLGALAVSALDIDPQALLATSSNAVNNELQDKIEICSVDTDITEKADILIANILLNPLLQLAPSISKLVKTNGKLALSGILAVQVEECLAAYNPWFNMNDAIFKDEWALLEGTRNSS